MTPEISDSQLLAKEIMQQIGRNSLWAAGARNFFALSEDEDFQGGLQFRVTITSPQHHHKIQVHLTWLDDYTVELWLIKRGEARLINAITGVYCDQLADTIYDLTNKKESYDPAILETRFFETLETEIRNLVGMKVQRYGLTEREEDLLRWARPQLFTLLERRDQKSENLKVEICTYEYGRFDHWATCSSWNGCYNIQEVLTYIKRQKQHFAAQGFYITWKVTRY